MVRPKAIKENICKIGKILGKYVNLHKSCLDRCKEKNQDMDMLYKHKDSFQIIKNAFSLRDEIGTVV